MQWKSFTRLCFYVKHNYKMFNLIHNTHYDNYTLRTVQWKKLYNIKDIKALQDCVTHNIITRPIVQCSGKTSCEKHNNTITQYNTQYTSQ